MPYDPCSLASPTHYQATMFSINCNFHVIFKASPWHNCEASFIIHCCRVQTVPLEQSGGGIWPAGGHPIGRRPEAACSHQPPVLTASGQHGVVPNLGKFRLKRHLPFQGLSGKVWARATPSLSRRDGVGQVHACPFAWHPSCGWPRSCAARECALRIPGAEHA